MKRSGHLIMKLKFCDWKAQKIDLNVIQNTREQLKNMRIM